MEERVAPRVLGWALVGVVLSGELLFGATRLPIGELRFDLQSVFAALVLLFAGLVLVLGRGGARPGRAFTFAALAFPAWLFMQGLPLPEGIRRILSPESVAWLHEYWPGPLHGLNGEELVAANAPSWFPLSLDPTATREFFFLALAASAAFLAARALFRRGGGQHRRILVVVALFGAFEAIYGLVEWVSSSPAIFWYTREHYLDCATGTLINRNHFAMLVYFGLGCALALLTDLRARRLAGEQLERDLALRVGLFAIVAIDLVAILASKSRAGMAGALIVFIPALPLLWRGARATRAVVIATAALVLVPAALVVGPELYERTGQVSHEWTGEGSRGAVLRSSLGLVEDFPVIGTGGATFEWVFATQRPPEIVGSYNYAHNDYLQTLIETGFLGLLLALLPALLFVVEILRRQRSGEDDRLSWPLLLALAAAMLHELVDFGLQIPANAVLFALLAGAAGVPARTRNAGGAARIAGVLALVALVPALLHGIASWPGLEDKLPWPVRPDSQHLAGRAEYRVWRDAVVEDADADRNALAAGIRHAATAQSHRPLSPYFAVSMASYLRAGMSYGEIDAASAPTVREELVHLVDRARGLDPWNVSARSRLMMLALAAGDIDGAFEDAQAAGRASAMRAKQALGRLERSGLPRILIYDTLSDSPYFLREMISTGVREADHDLVARLVPADVEPTLTRCRVGNFVADALRRVHELPGEPLLELCREQEEVRRDPRLMEAIDTWIAWDRFYRGNYEGAGELAPKLSRPWDRHWLSLQIAERREDWPAVLKHGHQLLKQAPAKQPVWEERLRLRLGRAYAQTGRIRNAIREYERLLVLTPENEEAAEVLHRLQRGDNPYRR